MPDKITPCIWYDLGQARAAADFYMSLGLPDSRIDATIASPNDNPSTQAGDELVVEFTLAGRSFMGLNGGPMFPQSEAISFQIYTDDQAETDRLWNAIVDNGGEESQCGWCKDRWGVNWQITPRRLMAFYRDPEPARTKAAFDAMMTMKKIDIAALEAAADAAG
ncbi:VOC family protein [Brevundimonas sp. VNH65]|uniref:VOC family protein n=1 Tax=Brevundimonas sp. VNH65 TaxID=3400917 RepID=UPI003C040C31